MIPVLDIVVAGMSGAGRAIYDLAAIRPRSNHLPDESRRTSGRHLTARS